jgi:hypothetical protein
LENLSLTGWHAIATVLYYLTGKAVEGKVMKYVIKLPDEADAQGFYLLMTTGVGIALPDNTYLLEKEQVVMLQKHGVPYTEISREQSAPALLESATFERI